MPTVGLDFPMVFNTKLRWQMRASRMLGDFDTPHLFGVREDKFPFDGDLSRRQSVKQHKPITFQGLLSNIF